MSASDKALMEITGHPRLRRLAAKGALRRAQRGGYDPGDPLGNAMEAGSQYLRGGVPGMLTSMGYRVPSWLQAAGRVVNNPDLNAAMGAVVPLARPMPRLEPLPLAAPGVLSDADRAIELRFAQALRDNPDQALAHYRSLEDSMGGKVLNTDLARELSADYAADRTKSAAVHEPASDFIKRLYAQKLMEPPALGELPEVTFTAGGTGAGKTSALKGMQSALDSSQIIYDTNMNGYNSARSKMQQALDAGKHVNVFYVYRDPLDALVNGALPRAARMEQTQGSGRTVPLSEHAATHVGAYDTVNRLADEFADDDRVRIIAIDNSHGPGGARAVPLESLPNPHQGDLYGQLQDALTAARAQGRISEAVYRGFAGSSGAPVNRGVSQQLEPQRIGGQPTTAPQATGQVLDFPRQPPGGGYERGPSDPYGLRYALPGSLHGGHTLAGPLTGAAPARIASGGYGAAQKRSPLKSAWGGYEQDIGNPADPEALRLQMAHRAAMPSSGVMDSLEQQAPTMPGGPAVGGQPGLDVGARLAAMRQALAQEPQTQPRGLNPYAALAGPGANTNPWIGSAGPTLGAMQLGYGMRPSFGVGGGMYGVPQTAIGGYGRPPQRKVNPMAGGWW